MNFGKIILFLSLCIFLLGSGIADAAVVDDSSISVNVTSQGHLPLLIKSRMESSVTVIAQQLVSGKNIDEISADKAQYENIIKDVFNKILVGYTVNSVNMSTDGNVNITVNLLPWDDVINNVDIQVKTDGVSPEIAALALNDIQDINEVFEDNLRGLPVDAVDWTNGVLKRSLNSFMETHLPEFRADFEMEPNTTAKVTVTIYPRMPVVRNIDLKMRSESMPNLYLLQERLFFQSQTDILLGVPIAFVDRHKDYFSEKLAKELDARPSFSMLGMRTAVNIISGEKTYITTYSNTKKYNVSIEGWADFGRDNDNESTIFYLHAGRMLTPKNEIFSETFFKPQQEKVDWAAGYYYHFDNKWSFGGRYFFDDAFLSLDTQRTFDKKWSAHFYYAPVKEGWQGAVRYNLHDFVGLEYVWEQKDNKKDNWIRLIGKF